MEKAMYVRMVECIASYYGLEVWYIILRKEILSFIKYRISKIIKYENPR